MLEHEDAIQNTQKYLASLLKEVTSPLPPLEKKTKLKKPTKDINSLSKTYKSTKKEVPTKDEKNSFSTKKSSPPEPKPTVDITTSKISNAKKTKTSNITKKIQKKAKPITPLSPINLPKNKLQTTPKRTAPWSLKNNLKNTFNAISAFTRKLNPFKTPPKQTHQKKSMEDSLKRLKKREEKLAKLLKDQKGNMT